MEPSEYESQIAKRDARINELMRDRDRWRTKYNGLKRDYDFLCGVFDAQRIMAKRATAQRSMIAEPKTAPVDEIPGNDIVNHPAHYTASHIECIDAIESALTPDELRGYFKGNALKYVWRERNKGGDTDIRKASWYLARLIGSADD